MWVTRCDVCGKQGPYAFDYRLYISSFKLHRIEPGDIITQNPINGTQNIHYSHTQNIYIYLAAMYLGKITQLTAR